MTIRSDHHEDDELDALLFAAAPVRAEGLDTPGVRDALAEIAAEQDAARRPPRTVTGRRRRTSRAVRVGLVVMCGLGGAGAVAVAADRAGWFDSPDSTESVAGEPYIDVASPAMRQAFDDAAAAYPLPPGQSYAAHRRAMLSAGGLKQVIGMRGELAMISGCRWQRAWLRADGDGDRSAADAAAAAMSRVAGSTDLAAVDGGGITAGFRALASAARDRDAEAVRTTPVCP